VKIFRRILRRKSSLAFGCLLWWALCGFPLPATAQPQLKVLSVTVSNVGPQTVSESLVRANIRIKEGDFYNRNSVDDDVKNLIATGYFANVRVADELSPEGIALLYIVQPKLKITEVLFTGNKKYSSAKLMKKVVNLRKETGHRVGEPLDEYQVFADAQEIKKLYEKAGYPHTKVAYRFAPDERAGRVSVTFEITESPKIRISDVVFDGATEFSQRKLRRTLKTRRHWWLSFLTQSGVLKEDQLEDDKEKLAEFYRDAGYIDFELKEVQHVQPDPRHVELHFIVSEGRKYKVGAVIFKGFTIFPTNDVYAKLKMGVGQTFTPKGLSKDMEIVQDLYGTKGYIDAQVGVRKLPNTQTGTMDLTYDVVEREKSYIEKIEIKGNTKTKDRVIRRELSVAPGEVFDMVRVKRSAERLRGLNFFEDQYGVDTQPERDRDLPPDRRNLVVAVREKNTGNIQLGAGFTSIDSLIGFVEVTQGNFDLFNFPSFQGAGQKARMRLQLGTERKDALISFVEPWFLDRKLEFSSDLYHRELNFLSEDDTYSENATGMRLGLMKALGTELLRGSLSYTLENVEIELNDRLHFGYTNAPGRPPIITEVPANVSEEIFREAGTRLVSKVGSSLVFDTRNSYLFPTKGQRSELRGELAGGPFGGDVDFYKIELKHARYIKGFMEGHLLELGARTGVAEAYNGDIDVPIFDRFFLGGLDSLRGYKYREIGPHDEFGEPLGGDTFWFATA